MPKYKNNTAAPIVWGRFYFEPGQELTVNVYIPTDKTGLTLVAATPAPKSQLLLFESYTLAAGGSQTVDIPYCNKFALGVLTANSGQATVTIGGISADIGESFGLSLDSLLWERNAVMTITSTAGATINVVVSEVV